MCAKYVSRKELPGPFRSQAKKLYHARGMLGIGEAPHITQKM
ncbi:MAG: hypothetical protein NVS9B15_25480 [Acidobacteriaceae bacterium]